MRRFVLSPLALVLLSACATDGYSTFTEEAGAVVVRSDFGNATMHNTLTQTAAEGYVVDLQKRFAAEVDSTITFAFNSAVLDAQARATLDRQAAWIRQFPEVRFRVYGHTDLVGSDDYNYRLGLRRAQAAVGYLVSRGISQSLLEAVVSRGETMPVVMTDDPARQNRRTVTEVLGFVGNHPRVLDGKYAAIVYRGYVESAVAPSPLAAAVTSPAAAGG